MNLKKYLILSSLFLGSCVSVKIGGSKGTPASGVVFESPASPFKEISSSSADKAWLSSRTGNTISFFSECGGSSDPSLTQIENDALLALSNSQVVSTNESSFNERAARQTVAEGQVDGVDVQLSLLVFKKNGCNYTVSYGGVKKNFTTEEKNFLQFINKFKAP